VQKSCNRAKKLHSCKKVAIARKSCICAKKLQSCKKVCRFIRRNSTSLQKVANAQKSYDCTKKLQMHEIVANAPKSCKCTKKLQINKKSVACPPSHGPTNSPTNIPLALVGFLSLPKCRHAMGHHKICALMVGVLIFDLGVGKTFHL
jgi:hypothetical protein